MQTLFFLTSKDSAGRHQVFFQNTREAPFEYAEPKAHWYEYELQLHPEDPIFGWSCIGNKDQIAEIISIIQTKNSICIKNKNIHFKTSLAVETSKYAISENSVGTETNIFEPYKTIEYFAKNQDWLQNVSSKCSVILEESFCNHISGIKNSKHRYKPIRPSGHWSDGELLDYFNRKVIKVEEIISPHITFRGTGDLQKKKELTGFKGICKFFPKNLKSIQIQFLNSALDFIHFEDTVSLNNGWGEWTCLFDKAPGSGAIRILNNGKTLGIGIYQLLLDINVNIKTLTSRELFQDNYGRKLNAEKEEFSGSPPKYLNWKSDFLVNETALSDEMIKIFRQLGEKLLIQDPFLLGIIEPNGLITNGSKCFLNALATTIIKHNLKEINFLVDPKKLKLNEKTKVILENYLEKFFKPFKKFGLRSITLSYAKTSFHDRYFLALESPNYLYHASKSANGFLESNDLLISLCEEELKPHLISQILYRLKNSSEKKIVA